MKVIQEGIGELLQLPDINDLPAEFKINLVVEYYSK